MELLCTVQTTRWHLAVKLIEPCSLKIPGFPPWPLPTLFIQPTLSLCKRGFSPVSIFHITSCLLVLCELRSSGASVHGLCALWQVHSPLWDGMHGWLTLNQPICHPQRGGGVCMCVCVCIFFSCSLNSMWLSHNMYVLILHMTLERAGVYVSPIVSGNPTLLLLISPLEETEFQIRPMKTCRVFMQNKSRLLFFEAAEEGT